MPKRRMEDGCQVGNHSQMERPCGWREIGATQSLEMGLRDDDKTVALEEYHLSRMEGWTNCGRRRRTASAAHTRRTTER